LPKMRSQGVKVEVEAIAGEDREAVRGQLLAQGMDEVMGRVLGADAEVEHRDQLAQWVNDDLEPPHVCPVAQPGPQFIELEVGEMQLLQPPVMQVGAVLAGACHPAGNRRLSMAEDAARGRDTQPFGQRRQHQPDALGGGFQAVEGRMAARTEGRPTGLTAQRLDALGFPVRAIADERMDCCVGDPVVGTGSIGTSKAVGDDAFWSAAMALELMPRAGRRSRCGPRQHSVAAAGRAIVGRAWFEQTLNGSRRGRRFVPLRVRSTIPQKHHPECAEHQRDDQC